MAFLTRKGNDQMRLPNVGVSFYTATVFRGIYSCNFSSTPELSKIADLPEVHAMSYGRTATLSSVLVRYLW